MTYVTFLANSNKPVRILELLGDEVKIAEASVGKNSRVEGQC